MPINFGYQLDYVFERPTPMLLMLHAHSSHLHSLLRPDDMRIEPYVSAQIYHDAFGNTCTRVEAPAGALQIYADGWLEDSALEVAAHPFAKEHPLSLLPHEALGYLGSSRFCDVDSVRDAAQQGFGAMSPGWNRVRAVSRFARRHYEQTTLVPRAPAASWRTDDAPLRPAREMVHFAISLCRALNIPARYCTGYQVTSASTDSASADFTTWFEAYLGGAWQAFDPLDDGLDHRRITIAHGRDCGDVSICTTFGASALTAARVWAHNGTPPARRRASPSADNFLNERFGEPAAHSPP